MAATTHIGWTDATWNIGIWCDKVSEGCLYCYMMRDAERYGKTYQSVVKTKTVFSAPLKWKNKTEKLNLKVKAGIQLTEKEQKELTQLSKIKLVFTSSLTDFWHPQIDTYRHEAFEIIRQCPEYTFQILTKRIERVPDLLPPDWGDGYKNVWLMATAENQERWDERIGILQSIPAQIRGVSIEPILSHIDISKGLKRDKNGLPLIRWIVVGGESGNDTGKWRYRKSRLEWYESIIAQANEAGIPVFVKQLGTFLSKQLNLSDRHGTIISEFPADLQIRQFPKVDLQ